MCMSASGVRVELLETRHAGPRHRRLPARPPLDGACGVILVVAAGGDGTIAEVANGLAGGRAPMPRLGVIPMGTANVLARELGHLPTDAAPGCRPALAFGRTRHVMAGRGAAGTEPDRLFVQMLGVGLDAQVVHRMPKPLKRALGRGAYVLQTLRELVRYRRTRRSGCRIDGVAGRGCQRDREQGHAVCGPVSAGAGGDAPSEPGFTVALFDHTADRGRR